MMQEILDFVGKLTAIAILAAAVGLGFGFGYSIFMLPH